MMNFNSYYYLKEDDLNHRPSLLLEGGAYGRILHPYEDDTLTFSQLKDIITQSFTGQLQSSYEKTDGINLMVTFKEGELRIARNKTHLKNFGKDSLTVKELVDIYQDKPDISETFKTALEDLETAITDVSNIFEEGKKFLSVEIISRSVKNVIPYETNMIIPHNIRELNENGEVVKEEYDAVVDIVDNIKSVQKNYLFKKNEQVKFLNKENKKLIESFHKELDEILEEAGLDVSKTIKDFKNIYTKRQDKLCLENLFLKLGVEVLNNIEKTLVEDKDSATERLKESLQNKIDEIQTSGNEEAKDKLIYHLDRIESVGGLDSIVATEGITFIYNNKTYKLTGLFKHINTIMNNL